MTDLGDSSKNSPSWEQFFETNPIPENYHETEKKIRAFVSCQTEKRHPVCLVTSGGTTIPLEVNTVRFVDNFSAGTRGSASAEQFLEAGYSVIFLFRQGSLEPWVRHINCAQLMSDMTVDEEKGGKITVSGASSRLAPIIVKRNRLADRLLSVPFSSLVSYLWLLRLCSQTLDQVSPVTQVSGPLLYLAAAVSDFYVPTRDLPEHKIQSSQGPTSVQLSLVPKMMKPLVSEWAPHCFIVSFKLETDPEILLSKSRTALDKYNHDLVIGNILNTRKKEVVFVFRDQSLEKIEISNRDLSDGIEIEKIIIEKLVKLHQSKTSQRNM